MKRIILLYIVLIVFHLAHLFEEIRGQFIGIELIGGLGLYLILNWILFCIVLGIFYFLLQKKRWTFYAGLIYAGIMVLNGIVHNIATIVSGQYYGGFAGGYTGIGLIIIGSLLIYYLHREIRTGS